MIENFRSFDVTDPFGRTWNAEFRWQQNAISIRRSDSIDCKYYLTGGGEKRELVIALCHRTLAAIAAKLGRDITDAWCLRLAGLHLHRLISAWEDMDKAIAVPAAADLEVHARTLSEYDQQERERVAHTH